MGADPGDDASANQGELPTLRSEDPNRLFGSEGGKDVLTSCPEVRPVRDHPFVQLPGYGPLPEQTPAQPRGHLSGQSQLD